MSKKRSRGAGTGSLGGDDSRDEFDEEYERALAQLMDESSTERMIRRMDPDQRTFFEQMTRFVGPIKQGYVDEPAGTGKTQVAFIAAVTLLRTRKISKIIYIRFPSKRGGKLGYLPGNLGEKEEVYFDPAFEALAKCGMQPEAVRALLRKDVFDFRTDARLRGTNLEDAFVIVDEAQNAMDIPEMELVLGRFHDSIRAAIVGDSRQCDSNVARYGRDRLNAFQVYQIHMTKEKWAERFRLTTNYRGVMAKYAAAVDVTLKELE